MAYDIVCVLAVCVFEYSKHGGNYTKTDKNQLFTISNMYVFRPPDLQYNPEDRED
jgi:hypothetical protein